MKTQQNTTAVVINGWRLQNTGVGMGVYLSRLVSLLADRPELDLTVVVPSSVDPVRLPDGVTTICLAGRSCGHDLLTEFAWDQKVAAVARRRPEAVYFSPSPSWLLRSPSRVVCTVHDCISHAFPAYMGRLMVRRWLLTRREAAMRRPECTVVTESEHARRDMVSRLGYDGDRVSVILAWLTDGFSVPRAQAQVDAVRERYDLPARYWLYVGGYDIRKNVDMLIRAYAAVRRRNSSTPPLVLAGRIPTDTSKPVCRVRQTVALELPEERDAIYCPGFIDDADIPGLYAGAELFVFPSLYEGFGLPPMEAMGCGCPAIAADNTSLREVVTDADYRFAAATPEPLARLLERAVSDPLPLNPGFQRNRFSAASATEAYVRLLTTP